MNVEHGKKPRFLEWVTEEKGCTNLRQSIQDKDLIWEVEMISSINAMFSHRCLLEVWVEMLGRKLAMSMELRRNIYTGNTGFRVIHT